MQRSIPPDFLLFVPLLSARSATSTVADTKTGSGGGGSGGGGSGGGDTSKERAAFVVKFLDEIDAGLKLRFGLSDKLVFDRRMLLWAGGRMRHETRQK